LSDDVVINQSCLLSWTGLTDYNFLKELKRYDEVKEAFTMKKRLLLLSIIVLLAFSGCAAPGKKSFDVGLDLVKNNRLEEAIAMFEDALSKEPGNKKYLEELKQAKSSLSTEYMKRARSILARTYITYDQAMSAYRLAEKALKLVPESKELDILVRDAKSKLDTVANKAKTMYYEAVKAIDNNRWAYAVRTLKSIIRFYPNYLDVPLKLRQAEIKGVRYYLKEADRFRRDEDWENVIKLLSLAKEISPNRADVVAALRDARARHNPDYYFSKAEEYVTKKRWDVALRFAKKAYQMSPTGSTAKRVNTIRDTVVRHYIDQCRRELSSERLYSAYLNAFKAINLDPSIKNKQEPKEVISELLVAMYDKATSYEDTGYLGNAFVWYEKVMGINQDYQDIFFRLQAVKDRIRDRVVKKIAIMDFTPPSGNPDAGRIVTDRLLSYITNTASSDVKILARDVLGDILKEIELGQAGIYDIESAKKAGKLKGTDVFIFGNVLHYNVETNVSEGYKVDNVVVGKKSVPNPAYQMWLMSIKGRPSEEDMKNAPPPLIEEEIRETVRYKVGTERKRATVGVSFRVIDVEEGEVVITKTIKKSYEVKDDYSEGVTFANIKYDPLEIPSDAELLDKVTREVVAQLSYEVLSRFQDLQTQYFNAGKMLEKKRKYLMAIEKFVDTLQIEEIKNISSPLSKSARHEIEQLMKRIAS